MKYQSIRLPEGELKIAKLVLGTDYFGTSVSQEMSFALLDAYLAGGGNCIDTARFYADWMPDGHNASERMLGEWLRYSKARPSVLLSTKGGHPPIENMQKNRLCRDCVERDLEESLSLLGTDWIDIYWLHRDSPERPVSEIMESLRGVVESGQVRAIGCSNWRIHRIVTANDYARNNGLPMFCMSQIQWSLAASTPEAHGDLTKVIMNDQEYAGYLENNLPVMCYSSQAKGFFVRPLAGVNAINEKSYKWFVTPENLHRKERVLELASRKNLTPTQVALGYILCNQLPAMALIGCRSLEQLKDSMSAGDVELSRSEIEWLLNG